MFSFIGNLKLFIMEAKELRIGNYVLEYSDILTIGNIYQNGFDFIYKGGCRFVEFIDIKPIPLTEEILLKCGFEITRQTEHPNNIWTVYGEECKFELEHITSFYLYDNKCFGTKVQYLHQLQNLYFALTNTELTVNL